MRVLTYILVAAGASFATTAHAMKPGLWEITSQMSGGGMPAMPAMSAAERKQMEAMGIKMPGAAERRRPPPALRAEGRQDLGQHHHVENGMQRRTEDDRHRLDHLSGRGKLQG
jgi:hypothetical protein